MPRQDLGRLERVVMLRRLIFLLIGAALIGCALVAPSWWTPLAGRIVFAGAFPATDAVRGPALPLLLISQYQGLATDNANCGPAVVAAAVRYARPAMNTEADPALVARARDATGIRSGDTYLPSLVQALSHFGVASAPLFAADGGSTDPLAAVRLALSHGRPVIVTLGGAALGRGAGYGDHFVLVVGMDPQAEQLNILDPDTQPAHTTAWQPGGREIWSAARVRAAIAAAQEHDALAVVVGARREGAISPSTPLLIGSGLALLLALCSGRMRRPRNRAL